jgi:hypothetical protein
MIDVCGIGFVKCDYQQRVPHGSTPNQRIDALLKPSISCRKLFFLSAT